MIAFIKKKLLISKNVNSIIIERVSVATSVYMYLTNVDLVPLCL